MNQSLEIDVVPAVANGPIPPPSRKVLKRLLVPAVSPKNVALSECNWELDFESRVLAGFPKQRFQACYERTS